MVVKAGGHSSTTVGIPAFSIEEVASFLLLLAWNSAVEHVFTMFSKSPACMRVDSMRSAS